MKNRDKRRRRKKLKLKEQAAMAKGVRGKNQITGMLDDFAHFGGSVEEDDTKKEKP